MNSEKYFVETTIIDRLILAQKPARDFLTCFLSAVEACSSTYIKMEFYRTVVADCVYLYNLGIEEGSIHGIHRRLIRGQRAWYRKRSFSRCLELFSRFLEECEDKRGEVSFDEFMETIKLHIVRLLRRRFHRLLAPDKIITDAIGGDSIGRDKCVIISKEPEILNTGKFYMKSTCRKEQAQCQLPQFIKRNESNFSKILETLQSLPEARKDKEIIVAINTIQAVLGNPDEARGQNCMNLGDAIIAVECPADAIILTTNEKHFKPLCKAKKKKIAVFREYKLAIEEVLR